MKNCFSCGEPMEKRSGTYHFVPPNNIKGGPIIIENAEWTRCTNCYEQMIPARLNKAIDAEVDRRKAEMQVYSENEIKLFTALGWAEYLEMSAIYPPTLYQMAVNKAFNDKVKSPEVDALRRGFESIKNCKPYRMTDEFEKLITVNTPVESKLTMDIHEKIKSGYFKNKLPYATHKADKVVNTAYNAEERRLDALFKKEALAEVGLGKHPKKDKIYAKAWEDGHSSGYYEVWACLQGLVDLFDDELDFTE